MLFNTPCLRRLIVSAAAVLLLGGTAQAALINVQFGETADGIFGPTTQYSGAAVLGASGDQWNFVGGSFNPNYQIFNGPGWGRTISDQPLFAADGAATSVQLSVTTPDAFVSLQGFNPIFKNSALGPLMSSFVFADGDRVASPEHDGPGLVTITGLTANALYDLVLFSAGDVIGRQTKFTVDGDVELVTPSGVAALVEGDTYARFQVAADDTGTLSILFAAGNGQEANLNGLQLADATAVPEPGSLALVGAGLAAIGLARRRKS